MHGSCLFLSPFFVWGIGAHWGQRISLPTRTNSIIRSTVYAVLLEDRKACACVCHYMFFLHAYLLLIYPRDYTYIDFGVHSSVFSMIPYTYRLRSMEGLANSPNLAYITHQCIMHHVLVHIIEWAYDNVQCTDRSVFNFEYPTSALLCLLCRCGYVTSAFLNLRGILLFLQ